LDLRKGGKIQEYVYERDAKTFAQNLGEYDIVKRIITRSDGEITALSSTREKMCMR
jgi:hypothetical protein